MAYKEINAGKTYRTHRPVIRDNFAMMADAMAGDIVMSLSPATAAPLPIDGDWQRDVVISIKNAAGEVHGWFNKAVTSGVAIADDSTAGVAAIPSTTLTFVNGQVTVTIDGTDADWLATETDTLTVAELVVLGVTCAAITSVETFTAA